MSSQTASGLSLLNISIQFGEFEAVSDVTMSIEPGEFFTLLGPSGCGKTTLLRAIAGFNQQSSGTISLGDTVLDGIPAHKRDTGMVFQSYAVFPHLSVWENVRYGLSARGIKGDEADERIRESLEMVDLTGYEKRMPKQLSGGQQQRVVIARAVAIRPRILLMDEPLANLDAKLRVRLRNDLKRLQKSLGITTVYVTHDQEEALSLSDRIAVMSSGHVLQVGTPTEIYDSPSTIGVAQFVGEGTFMRGTLRRNGSVQEVMLDHGQTLQIDDENKIEGDSVWIGLRPQDVRVVGVDDAPLTGVINDATYLGPYIRYDVDCGYEKPVMVEVNAHEAPDSVEIGNRVGLNVMRSDVMVFPGREQRVDL